MTNNTQITFDNMFFEIHELREEMETIDYMLKNEMEKNMILEAQTKMSDVYHNILAIRYQIKYHL